MSANLQSLQDDIFEYIQRTLDNGGVFEDVRDITEETTLGFCVDQGTGLLNTEPHRKTTTRKERTLVIKKPVPNVIVQQLLKLSSFDVAKKIVEANGYQVSLSPTNFEAIKQLQADLKQILINDPDYIDEDSDSAEHHQQTITALQKELLGID